MAGRGDLQLNMISKTFWGGRQRSSILQIHKNLTIRVKEREMLKNPYWTKSKSVAQQPALPHRPQSPHNDG